MKYGVAGSEDVPLSQLSFGEQREKPKHAPVPPPTFVQGVGMLGPDLGGYVKGDMMSQEFTLKNNADARAEEELGIKKEEFGLKKDYLKIAQEELGIKLSEHDMVKEEFSWKRDDREKQKMIEAGMETAGMSGGYSAVIDYLKGAAPEKAIQFHAQKLGLDAALMSTDTMKAVAANDKSKALLEGYGVIGKMGSAVLKAAPEDRENLFKTMQPMLRSILGAGAPQTLEEAIPMYMLSVAQATPENMLYKTTTEATQMQSSIGKLDADINAKLKSGADPLNDKGLQDMISARKAYSIRYEQAELAKASTELKMQTNQLQTETSKLNNTEKMQKVLDSTSKDFLTYMKDYTGVSGAFKVLEKDPKNSQAQGVVSTMMASAIQSGVLTEPDWERSSRSNAGFKKMIENYGTQWATGKAVLLAPDEISNLNQVFQQVTKSKVAAQKYREKEFQDTKIEGWGDILDKNKITYPSSIYDKMETQGKYDRIINQYELGNLPPEMQQQAAEAIDQGVDPAAIKSYIAKQQEEAQKNAKQ